MFAVHNNTNSGTSHTIKNLQSFQYITLTIHLLSKKKYFIHIIKKTTIHLIELA